MKLSLCITLIVLPACAVNQPQIRSAHQKPVRFPEHFPLSQQIPGAQVQALMAVARDLDKSNAGDRGEDGMTRCLQGVRAWGFTVVREGDVFYVLAIFDPAFCGSSETYVDTGMVYAVDANGKILQRQRETAPRN